MPRKRPATTRKSATPLQVKGATGGPFSVLDLEYRTIPGVTAVDVNAGVITLADGTEIQDGILRCTITGVEHPIRGHQGRSAVTSGDG